MVIGALAVTFTYLFVPLWIFAYVGHLVRKYETPVYMRVPSQGWKAAFGQDGVGGAIASEVDICSSSGAYVLKRGGSAVDGVSCSLQGNCCRTVCWRGRFLPFRYWRWWYFIGEIRRARTSRL